MSKETVNKTASPHPPPNVSAKYYTDPIYSTEALYGGEEDVTDNRQNSCPEEVPDESVESWGWIQNT